MPITLVQVGILDLFFIFGIYSETLGNFVFKVKMFQIEGEDDVYFLATSQ